MRLSRRLALVITAVALIAAGSASGAEAKADAPRRVQTHSWDGTCSVEGLVHFSPAATALQQLLAVTYDATGTCTGTLDGNNVTSAPVAMHHRVQVDGSCLRAQTLAPGPGVLTFTDGPAIGYTVEFTYVGTEGVLTFRGQRSGQAIGHGSFLTPNSSPDAAAGCYNGEGVTELLMDVTLTTQSPLASREPRGRD